MVTKNGLPNRFSHIFFDSISNNLGFRCIHPLFTILKQAFHFHCHCVDFKSQSFGCHFHILFAATPFYSITWNTHINIITLYYQLSMLTWKLKFHHFPYSNVNAQGMQNSNPQCHHFFLCFIILTSNRLKDKHLPLPSS